MVSGFTIRHIIFALYPIYMGMWFSAQLYNLHYDDDKEMKEIHHILIQNKHSIAWAHRWKQVTVVSIFDKNYLVLSACQRFFQSPSYGNCQVKH